MTSEVMAVSDTIVEYSIGGSHRNIHSVSISHDHSTSPITKIEAEKKGAWTDSENLTEFCCSCSR